MSSLKDWSVTFPRGACSLSHMDKVLWKSEVLPVKGRGLLNIPEISVPPPQIFPFSGNTTLDDSSVPEQEAISPTLSIDSGRSTGTSLWPSSKYFVHGGPGFSIGIVDSTTGTIEHLPIPFPSTQLDQLSTSDNFCTSEVTCLALVGETQLWAGTESGSLHVFELSPGPRLTQHSYCKLPDPICCLKTDSQFSTKFFSMNGKRKGKIGVSKSEIMVGSSNGTLTIISGEANEKGSLLNVNKSPRKVVHLGDGQGCCRVQCVAMVSMMGIENCWCGCGSRIIILQRGSWKVLARLDAMVGFPLEESEDDEDGDEERGWMDLQVRHLEPTEHGVWSSMEHSPAVVLWDTKYFSPKLKISCCQTRPETPLVNHQALVTALAQLEDVVCVGTQGGYLLLFHVYQKSGNTRTRNSISLNGTKPTLSLPSSPKMAGRTRRQSGDMDYTLMGASHCSTQPVVSIHLYGSTPPPHSPVSTPSCSPLNILVLTSCGSAPLNSSHQTTVHLYEVTGGSPMESPLCSPQGKGGGRVSAMSSKSLPSGPLRKCNLNNLEDLPELTLHTVSKSSVSYLPLQKSS